jgi:hypothetical protein
MRRAIGGVGACVDGGFDRLRVACVLRVARPVADRVACRVPIACVVGRARIRVSRDPRVARAGAVAGLRRRVHHVIAARARIVADGSIRRDQDPLGDSEDRTARRGRHCERGRNDDPSFSR